MIRPVPLPSLRFPAGILLAALSLSAPLGATLLAESSFTPRTMIAYTPLQVWDSETVARLDVRPGAIYTIGTLDPYGRILALGSAYTARNATLSPHGGLIAFAGSMGPDLNRRIDGIFVADTSGAIRASFPGAKVYRWNLDGSILAVAFSRSDSGQITFKHGLLLWRPELERVASVAIWPEEIDWISEEILLAGAGGFASEVNARDLSFRTSRHRGVTLSPDLRYSLRRTGSWKHPSIVDERTGRDLTGCATLELRPPAQERKGRPGGKFGLEPAWGWDPELHLAHWIRLPGADHLLCATVCGGPQVPGVPPPASCRTVVFDVETGKLLASYPGYGLGPSADHRGVMRLTPQDGVEIGDVFVGTAASRALDRKRTRKSPSPAARVDVEAFQVRTLGTMRERIRIAASPCIVRSGDWLPSLLPSAGNCDRAFRVLEVASAGRVVIRYDGRNWVRALSGGRPMRDDTSEHAEAIVMNEGLILIPRAGGWNVVSGGFSGPSPYEVKLTTRQIP